MSVLSRKEEDQLDWTSDELATKVASSILLGNNMIIIITIIMMMRICCYGKFGSEPLSTSWVVFPKLQKLELN